MHNGMVGLRCSLFKPQALGQWQWRAAALEFEHRAMRTEIILKLDSLPRGKVAPVEFRTPATRMSGAALRIATKAIVVRGRLGDRRALRVRRDYIGLAAPNSEAAGTSRFEVGRGKSDIIASDSCGGTIG